MLVMCANVYIAMTHIAPESASRMRPVIDVGTRLVAQHLALVFVHLRGFDWTNDRGHAAVGYILQMTVFPVSFAVQLAGVWCRVAAALGIEAWNELVGQAFAPGSSNQGGRHKEQHAGCPARTAELQF